MSGYQEVITDPSYAGQVIAFTYPQSGTTASPPLDDEAARPWCRGVVVRDLPPRPSNWRATGSFEDFLVRHGVPGITGIDTRRLTRHLRDRRRHGMCVRHRPRGGPGAAAAAEPGTTGWISSPQVTPSAPYRAGVGPAAGRRLRLRGEGDHAAGLGEMATVTVVPADTCGRRRLGARAPTASFSPTGPGTPPPSADRSAIVADLLGRVPIFGICLGHQLLGDGPRSRTYKLALRPPRRQPPGAVGSTRARWRSRARTTTTRWTASPCRPRGRWRPRSPTST